MLCATNRPRKKESRRKIISERRIGHAWRFRKAIGPPYWSNLRLFTGLALVLRAQCTLPNSSQCTLCTLHGRHFYITSCVPCVTWGDFPEPDSPNHLIALDSSLCCKTQDMVLVSQEQHQCVQTLQMISLRSSLFFVSPPS